MAEGTVLIRVIREPAGKVIKARASFTTTARPPRLNGANNSKTERSKQIEVEANTLAISPAVKTACVHDRNATTL
jgi:hypothetical protein